MKIICRVAILLLLATLALTLSCSEDDNDYSQRYNNLIGEWRVSRITQEVYQNQVVAEYNNNFELILDGDGTGVERTIWFNDSIITQDLNWYYQFDPERVIMTYVPNGFSLREAEIFEVELNESTDHKWISESTLFLPDLVDKYVYRYSLVPL